ncbi:hypothetical protein R6Q59_006089 [Mikania micrantha]
MESMFILKGKLPLCLLSFIFIHSIHTNTTSTPHFIAFYCENASTYTINSTYQRNLNTTLAALPATDNGFGFYNLTTGQDNDTVHSVALCRGDVNPDVCRSCVNNSIVRLGQLCPNQKEAIGYYDNCLMKYSNEVILRSTRIKFYVDYSNIQTATDIDRFNGALGPLLSLLKGEAAGGNELLKFATGSTNETNFSTIYGLVQCSPDLSQQQCSSCLEGAINQISSRMNGKVGGRILLPMCNFRYEISQFFNQTTRFLLPPPLPPSGKKNNTIIIIIVIVIVIILIVSLCIFMVRFKQKKRKTTTSHPPEGLQTETMDNRTVEHYDFNTVKEATNNFSEENKLGQGGFGTVYKGKLTDGKQIAVKRLAHASEQGDLEQGDLEFKNEVLLVANLQHRNLIRLLGFSKEASERLLIYEYMPNGSLHQFIFDPSKRTNFDWEKRYNIIKGIAKGLLYLHEDSRLRIIHRDMKASNVLLDAEMTPKIADFGMARLFKFEETQEYTSRIAGTRGYMAPEYLSHGQVSVKLDVFSYGVLLLEMVTGQKNQCFQNGDSIEDLLSFAWKSWKNGTTTNIIDPTLKTGTGSLHDIIRSIHIGLLCVQEKVVDRPTMASVILMLNSFSITLLEPTEPAFFMHSNIDPEMPLLHEYNSSNGRSILEEPKISKSRSRSSQYSVNEVSISDFIPR